MLLVVGSLIGLVRRGGRPRADAVQAGRARHAAAQIPGAHGMLRVEIGIGEHGRRVHGRCAGRSRGRRRRLAVHAARRRLPLMAPW